MNNSYMRKILDDITSNYLSRIKFTNDIKFKYDSINSFIVSDEKNFSVEFEEMGMKFTNFYNVQDIIQSLFYFRVENHILNFEQNKCIEAYNSLLDSYSWLTVSMILSEEEKTKLSGEFFQDIVFACLFSYCYLPKMFKKNLKYLKFYYESESTNWNDKDFIKNYGYSDIFQLLLYIIRQEKFDEDISFYRKVEINVNYNFVLENILSNDKDVIKKIYDNLLEFRIKREGKSYLDTFNHECWKYLPIEIFSVLLFRKRNNLDNNISNWLVEYFSPWLYTKDLIPVDKLTTNLIMKIS